MTGRKNRSTSLIAGIGLGASLVLLPDGAFGGNFVWTTAPGNKLWQDDASWTITPTGSTPETPNSPAAGDIAYFSPDDAVTPDGNHTIDVGTIAFQDIRLGFDPNVPGVPAQDPLTIDFTGKTFTFNGSAMTFNALRNRSGQAGGRNATLVFNVPIDAGPANFTMNLAAGSSATFNQPITYTSNGILSTNFNAIDVNPVTVRLNADNSFGNRVDHNLGKVNWIIGHPNAWDTGFRTPNGDTNAVDVTFSLAANSTAGSGDQLPRHFWNSRESQIAGIVRFKNIDGDPDNNVNTPDATDRRATIYNNNVDAVGDTAQIFLEANGPNATGTLTLNLENDGNLGSNTSILGVPVATAAGTILQVNQVISALTMRFATDVSNSSRSGSVSGSGSVLKTGSGVLQIETVNTYSGGTNITAGTVRITDAGTVGSGPVNNNANLTVFNNNALGDVNGSGITTIGDGTTGVTVSANHFRQGSLVVAAGSTAVVNADSSAAGVSKVTTLTLGALAKLDLKDNKLITTDAVGSATAGVYDGVSGQIQSGRNGGGWGGSGIVTSQSLATTSNFTSIGIATASQVKNIAAGATAVWGGQTVTGSDTLVMYTYGGDANLDGKLNVDDYGRIDFNVALGTAGWFNGDFNYDGKINVDDYGIIDFNIGIQGAPFYTAGGGNFAGAVAVPEPASATALAIATLTLGLRHRRLPRRQQRS